MTVLFADYVEDFRLFNDPLSMGAAMLQVDVEERNSADTMFVSLPNGHCEYYISHTGPVPHHSATPDGILCSNTAQWVAMIVSTSAATVIYEV